MCTWTVSVEQNCHLPFPANETIEDKTDQICQNVPNISRSNIQYIHTHK